MAKTTATKIIWAAVLALAALGGYMAFKTSSMHGAAAQMPGGEMPPMPVPVVEIAEKPVQIWKEFSGRLSAVDFVEIRPQVSGQIEEVHFEDGQIVKKGDLLFTIDPRPYEAAVAQAKADVSAAWNDVQYAKKEMARAEELLKTGAISKQGYDQRINSLKVNQSAVNEASARVKAAEVNLDRTTIEAPVDGRISRAELTTGNLVDPAAGRVLTTIVSDKEIYAEFDVDEQTYLTFVRARTGGSPDAKRDIPVRLLLTNDEKVYLGKIHSFDNQISTTSGTIRARGIFTNDDGALLPGMFARVQIGSSGTENKITVTEKAIQTDQSRKFVYVVGQDNIATYREVQPGDSVAGERVILSGLAPGDRVIVDGLMKLRPGAKIQPMSPEELAAMKAQMAQQAGAPGGPPPAEIAPAESANEVSPPEAKAEGQEEQKKSEQIQ